MTAGFARTTEGEALVARTAKHFAHKVVVETEGAATVIRTRFGAAGLQPQPEGVAIDLRSETDAEAERLREVIASHLERFARSPLEIEWHH